MPEVLVNALEVRLQKQLESARRAFADDRSEQAAEICAAILREQPGCLPVRKLERMACIKLAASRQGGLARVVRAVSASPFLLSGTMRLKDEPRLAVVSAENVLRRDPQNVTALGLLGQAALALGWPDTAAFALEAARDLEPGRPDTWVLLSRAYLAGGRAPEAVRSAEEARRLRPDNPEVQALFREASVAAAMARGKWDEPGDLHSKLREPTGSPTPSPVPPPLSQQPFPPNS